MEWIHEVLILVGVLIGAITTPWVTSKIEKRRRKLSIKPELIKLVYRFYNLKKESVSFHNNHHFVLMYLKVNTTDYSVPTLSPEQRAIVIRDYDLIAKETFSLTESLRDNWTQMLLIESELHAILPQIEEHFGKNVYVKINKLVRPIIDEANDPVEIFDYERLHVEQVRILRLPLMQKLREKHIEIDAKCKILIDKLLVSI